MEFLGASAAPLGLQTEISLTITVPGLGRPAAMAVGEPASSFLVPILWLVASMKFANALTNPSFPSAPTEWEIFNRLPVTAGSMWSTSSAVGLWKCGGHCHSATWCSPKARASSTSVGLQTVLCDVATSMTPTIVPRIGQFCEELAKRRSADGLFHCKRCCDDWIGFD